MVLLLHRWPIYDTQTGINYDENDQEISSQNYDATTGQYNDTGDNADAYVDDSAAIPDAPPGADTVQQVVKTARQ